MQIDWKRGWVVIRDFVTADWQTIKGIAAASGKSATVTAYALKIASDNNLVEQVSVKWKIQTGTRTRLFYRLLGSPGPKQPIIPVQTIEAPPRPGRVTEAAPVPKRAILFDLYVRQELGTTQIGRHFRVSPPTVLSWLRHRGIPVKSSSNRREGVVV